MSNLAGNGPQDAANTPAPPSQAQYLKYLKYLKYSSHAVRGCGRYARVTNEQKTPPRELRYHQVKVSLSETEYLALLAEAEDEAAALVVRRAVKQYLSARKKKGKQ
jgi:hypothetical protein